MKFAPYLLLVTLLFVSTSPQANHLMDWPKIECEKGMRLLGLSNQCIKEWDSKVTYKLELIVRFPGRVCSTRKSYETSCSDVFDRTVVSSDGFKFKSRQLEEDEKWYCKEENPCSALADWDMAFSDGTRKFQIVVTNIGTGKSVIIRSDPDNGEENGGWIERKETPDNYPYLVFEWVSSQGASCCVKYGFYEKGSLSTPPFVIDYTRNDVLDFYADGRTYYPGWKEQFSAKKRELTNPNHSAEVIDDLLEKHFLKSRN